MKSKNHSPKTTGFPGVLHSLFTISSSMKEREREIRETNLGISARSGLHERSEAGLGAMLDVCLAIDEQTHHLVPALEARQRQRRVAVRLDLRDKCKGLTVLRVGCGDSPFRALSEQLLYSYHYSLAFDAAAAKSI